MSTENVEGIMNIGKKSLFGKYYTQSVRKGLPMNAVTGRGNVS